MKNNIEARFYKRPWPMLWMDEYFEPRLFQAACDSWPERDETWTSYEPGIHVLERPAVPASLVDLIDHLHSVGFRKWLRSMFGIWDLTPDSAHFGGCLIEHDKNIEVPQHVSHNCIYQPTSEILYTAVNLVVFFDEWRREQGGELILGDDAMLIQPIRNRLVAWQYGEKHWTSRRQIQLQPSRSMVLHYYSPTRPESFRKSHPVVYRS